MIKSKITMKQKLHFIAIVFMVGICSAAFGQSSFTDKIPYQAIARNANGNILANQTLTVRVSLNQKGADAEKKSFYSEVHRLQTNEEGYFSIEMGDGDPQAGEWTEIPWYLGKFELDVEIDGQGTSDFQLFSRSELQSVPFAFTAQTADKILKPDVVTGIQVIISKQCLMFTLLELGTIKNFMLKPAKKRELSSLIVDK